MIPGDWAYEDVDRFQRCEWPPPPFADPDGYSDVIYRSTTGPGEGGYTGADSADRLKAASCERLKLAYSFGSQGHYAHEAPFDARVGTVVWAHDGTEYADEFGPIPFYPGRDELVVLRNGRREIDSAECVE